MGRQSRPLVWCCALIAAILIGCNGSSDAGAPAEPLPGIDCRADCRITAEHACNRGRLRARRPLPRNTPAWRARPWQ